MNKPEKIMNANFVEIYNANDIDNWIVERLEGLATCPVNTSHQTIEDVCRYFKSELEQIIKQIKPDLTPNEEIAKDCGQ